MPLDPFLSPPYSIAFETFALYRSILRFANTGLSSEQEPDLGGKLLYAGELNQLGRALVSAGNIAGAASLSASADPTVQKLAIRDGIADFLVNSLDEALRILKNEIRKRNAVAVCVAAAPPTIEQEMLERGVKADLHRDELTAGENEPSENLQIISWRVGSSQARWLPKLDSIASESLRPESGPTAAGCAWRRAILAGRQTASNSAG